ncbi:hypothetical protein HYU07_05065 [Candidatus Woesearchaeota archaeon]|nr:hypothetical protein [Candidatus Woesearchaeota archaeon]
MKYQQTKLYELVRNTILTGLLVATPLVASGCLKSTDPYIKAEQSLDTVAKYASRKPRTEAEAKSKQQFMAKAKKNIVQITAASPELKEELWEEAYLPSEKQQKAIETVSGMPLTQRVGVVLKPSADQINSERNKLYSEAKGLDEAATAIDLYDVKRGDTSSIDAKLDDDPEIARLQRMKLNIELLKREAGENNIP